MINNTQVLTSPQESGIAPAMLPSNASVSSDIYDNAFADSLLTQLIQQASGKTLPTSIVEQTQVQLKNLGLSLDDVRTFFNEHPEADITDMLAYMQSEDLLLSSSPSNLTEQLTELADGFPQPSNTTHDTEPQNQGWVDQIITLTEFSKATLNGSSEQTLDPQLNSSAIALPSESDDTGLTPEVIPTSDMYPTGIQRSSGVYKKSPEGVHRPIDETIKTVSNQTPSHTFIEDTQKKSTEINQTLQNSATMGDSKIVTIETQEHSVSNMTNQSISMPVSTTGSLDNTRPLIPIGMTSLQSPVLGQKLDESIRWMVGQRVSQAELKVSPEALGPISITLRLEGERAVVSFGSNHEHTRLAIEQSLQSLKDTLADQGVYLEHSHVGTEQESRQFNDSMNRGADRSTRLSSETSNESSDMSDGTAHLPAVTHDGLLNTYA